MFKIIYTKEMSHKISPFIKQINIEHNVNSVITSKTGLRAWVTCNMSFYYMALSHKDWELPNARIWLAEMDIDRGLDFPI